LDENYFFYSEDADWNFCARRAGFDCEFAPVAIVWHEGSATRKRIPRKGYYWYNRSAFRLYFKHFPLVFLFTAVFFRLIISSLFEIFLFRRPIGYISLRIAAFAHTLLELNEIITIRRKINRLGKLPLKIRFGEFLKVGKQSVDLQADSSTEEREVL
jgi:GT2 family glycosyltransferase